MIDYIKILRETREGEYKWVIERYKPSVLPIVLSESSLTDHLANYSNKYVVLSSFLGFANDPRMIDGRSFPYGLFRKEDLKEDTRTFNPITLFSKYYLGYAPKDKPIISTARLESFIQELDKRTFDLNAVMPAIKHPNSDRDLIAKKFTEFASLVALSEKTLENAIFDLKPYLDLIYSYKLGKIFVTNPYYHNKIPEGKKHLFAL